MSTTPVGVPVCQSLTVSFHWFLKSVLLLSSRFSCGVWVPGCLSYPKVIYAGGFGSWFFPICLWVFVLVWCWLCLDVSPNQAVRSCTVFSVHVFSEVPSFPQEFALDVSNSLLRHAVLCHPAIVFASFSQCRGACVAFRFVPIPTEPGRPYCPYFLPWTTKHERVMVSSYGAGRGLLMVSNRERACFFFFVKVPSWRFDTDQKNRELQDTSETGGQGKKLFSQSLMVL